MMWNIQALVKLMCGFLGYENELNLPDSVYDDIVPSGVHSHLGADRY